LHKAKAWHCQPPHINTILRATKQSRITWIWPVNIATNLQKPDASFASTAALNLKQNKENNMKQKEKDELTLAILGAIVLFVVLYFFVKGIIYP
jgi:16S rRNA U1498 N3-methylase RsmE